MRRHRLSILAWLLALACVGGDAERPALRIGTSGDYAPFSQQDAAGARSGFDVEVARAYARERGLAIHWVPLRWATLDRDFAAGRFDVVMSGVTVRPERSLAGRFSVPVTTSGVVVLTRTKTLGASSRFAVNAGGHLERVARKLFPASLLRPLSPNSAVREALLSGAADAAVTDTLEAPAWLAGTSGLRVLGPYTHDWKAYWLPAGAGESARDLDAWLLAREADGTLAALRARHLPESAREATAAPLAALGAALEERLALMPLVAEAKRASGAEVRAPEQEQAVLAAAGASVREAAAREGTPPPSDAAVRSLFAALIDAASEIQEQTLAGPPAETPPADLDGVLRPSLARISERIARLLVRLPAPLDEAAVKETLDADRAARPHRRRTRAHRACAAGAPPELAVGRGGGVGRFDLADRDLHPVGADARHLEAGREVHEIGRDLERTAPVPREQRIDAHLDRAVAREHEVAAPAREPDMHALGLDAFEAQLRRQLLHHHGRLDLHLGHHRAGHLHHPQPHRDADRQQRVAEARLEPAAAGLLLRDRPLVLAQLDGERARALDRPQLAAHRQRDRAALLRDHDAEGVAALREAERRRVARADVDERCAIGRERQVHGEARDAVVRAASPRRRGPASSRSKSESSSGSESRPSSAMPPST